MSDTQARPKRLSFGVASAPRPRCGARKSPRSSAYCEKPPGHPGEHMGRTQCGYWKGWPNPEGPTSAAEELGAKLGAGMSETQARDESLRIAYADPPYPGQSKRHYGDHPDYAGEVDHADLLQRLEADYDGWVLHTSSAALRDVLPLCPDSARVMAWVKPFCAFKRNVSVAYAWEPVIVKVVRKPVVSGRTIMRDYIAEPITMQRGLVGAKPEAVCRWCFEVVGAEPTDELHDLFPGSGAVARAWDAWRATLRMAV